ncbi:FAD-binding oxidoreductase [Aspergillus homomorphus CBS 101889]|uniref:FAD-binding PCMH-type domain-containing protein n=1 Tax=Aspergillus homomorphus (strain CBS 101889) TaxID=1450537 RepID=A0A395HQL5_ASPHC|nr:hypothetical protein BO97DRAFT_144439 [Aspergillus homomorphus CBS 101889]RAL10241.1 hypothetical protein BO97DRAFT_144439 [Aspergillus homomorphus CBS 101889]
MHPLPLHSNRVVIISMSDSPAPKKASRSPTTRIYLLPPETLTARPSTSGLELDGEMSTPWLRRPIKCLSGVDLPISESLASLSVADCPNTLLNTYGLTCDNVVNFEVVLLNATIVNANRTCHPDLWWALRGGGNLFGIVTRSTFQAHPLEDSGKGWGGIRVYTADKRQAIFEALATFIRDYPDAKAAVIPTFDSGLPGALISNPMLFFFYDGSTPSEGACAGLEAIEALLDGTKTTTYTDLANQAGGAKIYGIKAAARVNTFPNLNPHNMSSLLEAHWSTYQFIIKNDASRNIDIQIGTFRLQPLSVRIARVSQERGGNALGLNPDHGDRFFG